jgi:hypothetical protein
MAIRAGFLTDQAAMKLSRGTRKLTVWLCTCLAAFCLTSSLKAQQRTIGHVLDVEEDWYLDGRPGQPLAKGAELPASGVIRSRSPSRFAFIIISYSDNNQVITKRCRNPGECDQPILLPRAVQRQASYREIFVEKFFGWVRGNPVTSSPHAGRSEDGVLREAVVQITGGQVDLSPIFTEMNSGTYDVRLERRMPDGKMVAVPSAKAINAKWELGKVTTTLGANFQPGLYELILLEKRGAAYESTLTTAWFLAGNLEQYAQTVAPFCEATHLTATWKNEVSDETVRTFLRAALIQLATESRSGRPAK